VRYYLIMISVWLFASSAIAQEVCPEGLMYVKNNQYPAGDCVCPDGRKQNFNLSQKIKRFGGCMGKADFDGFQPPSITSLVLWLDATDPAGNGNKPVENSEINLWFDKSGKQNHARKSSENSYNLKAPVYKPEQMQGSSEQFPAIYFTSGAHLEIGNPSSLNLKNSDYSLFVVSQKSDAEDSDLICKGNPKFNGICLGYKKSNGLLRGAISLAGQNTDSENIQISAAALNKDKTNIFSTIRSSSHQYSYVLGGALPDNPQTVSYSFHEKGRWMLGSRNGAFGSHTGGIAEIILYSRALSDDDRRKVERYLAIKWQGGT
jgi:hypothetical protein